MTRLLLFIIFMIVAACTTPHKIIDRSPSGYGGMNSPCKDSRDCSNFLICKSGWCKGFSNQKEAYEACRDPNECVSNRCENNKCIPSSASPADNEQECFMNVPTNCRSRKTNSGKCQASSFFPGFAGMSCSAPTDCISKRCGPSNKCLPGTDSLSCLWVNETCSNGYDCCSKTCANNRCVGKGNLPCSTGNCGDIVGKICATGNQRVEFETECCSLSMRANYCVPGFNDSPIYCLKSDDCPSGLVCDLRHKICAP